MKRMHLILAAAMTAMTVLSCQKNGSDMTIVPTGDGVIRFTVEAPDVDLQTKATVVTTSTIETNGFNCSAATGAAGAFVSAWNNVSFSKGSTYYEGGKFWPSSDPSYKFFASNATLTHNIYGCTVAATNATDVVCAYLASPTYETPNALSFSHIFARIGNFTVTAVDGYTITNVHATITPNTGGTYNIATGNGQTNGTGWSSLTTGSATDLANSTPGTKANDLYLVPGTYSIAFSWTASKDDYVANLSKTVTGVSIVGGKVNAITAGLTGDASAIQFTVSVADWGAGTVAIGTVEPD